MQNLLKPFLLSILISLTSQFYELDNMCLNTDDRLSKLRLHEVKILGKGSFGQVKGDDLVAVKNMEIKDASDKKRFNMEIKALIALSKEFDMAGIKDQGCFFKNKLQFSNYPIQIKLAMERMQGDLNKIRFSKDTDIHKSLFWRIDMAIKMLLALKKMHLSKLLHMDIKTDNVFMLNEYTPVLGDFGLTHTFSAAQKETDRMGTMIYVGSEILQHKPIYSDKSDVYAMGVTIYELFQGIYLNDVLKYHNVNNIFKSTLTKKFDAAFKNALNYADKDKRQTVDEFIIDLLTLLKDVHNDKLYNRLQSVEGKLVRDFEVYQQNELKFYEESLKDVSLTYKDTLIQKYHERQNIYMKFLHGVKEDEQTREYATHEIIQDLNTYCQTQENIYGFFVENLSKNLLVQSVQRTQSINPSELSRQHSLNGGLKNNMIQQKQRVIRKVKKPVQANMEIIKEQPAVVQRVVNHKPLAAQNIHATEQKPQLGGLTQKQQRVQALFEKHQKAWAKNGIKI